MKSSRTKLCAPPIIRPKLLEIEIQPIISQPPPPSKLQTHEDKINPQREAPRGFDECLHECLHGCPPLPAASSRDVAPSVLVSVSSPHPCLAVGQTVRMRVDHANFRWDCVGPTNVLACTQCTTRNRAARVYWAHSSRIRR
jgi:hypothetical protein